MEIEKLIEIKFKYLLNIFIKHKMPNEGTKIPDIKFINVDKEYPTVEDLQKFKVGNIIGLTGIQTKNKSHLIKKIYTYEVENENKDSQKVEYLSDISEYKSCTLIGFESYLNRDNAVRFRFIHPKYKEDYYKKGAPKIFYYELHFSE